MQRPSKAPSAAKKSKAAKKIPPTKKAKPAKSPASAAADLDKIDRAIAELPAIVHRRPLSIFLGVSKKTIDRAIARGDLETIAVGERLKPVTRESVGRLLRAGLQQSA